MPPKSLPARKKNGQFTVQTRPPPSSLATPPVTRSSQEPPSGTATPLSSAASPEQSALDRAPTQTALSSRANLSALVDSSSDLDDAPAFVVYNRSRSASPTIPAPHRSHFPSPSTSDFPTSLDSSQLGRNQDSSESRYTVPAGYSTTLQFPPSLTSQPCNTTQSHFVPAPVPSQLPRPASQHTKQTPSSSLPHTMSTMSNAASTSLAAMPSSRSSKAPHFSGDEDELVSEFLQEYEDLADGCRLNPVQKVETILRYIPRPLQHLWKTRPGYQARDWDYFKADIENLHPDVETFSHHTEQGLETFRKLSAKSRIHNEAEVMKYYRNFLTIADPLLTSHCISNNEYNSAFFKGFHLAIQSIITQRYREVDPHHPVHKPFPI